MQTIRKAEAILCPDTLIDPHRLTKKTLASFNKAKTDERGILLSRNKIHLDVRVTQASLDRACLIMDAMLKALESRGLKVRTSGERPLKTIVEVDGENIEISLDEKIRRIDYKPAEDDRKKYRGHEWMIPKYSHLPTGELSLNVRDWHAPRKTWSDGKRQRLENCLGSFIQGLNEAAKRIKENREQRRLDQMRWDEEKCRREEQARLSRIEEKKADKLISDANSWHQANNIRSFILQMAQLQSDDAQLSDWIEWSIAYTNKIDPLLQPENLPFTADEMHPYF